MRFHRFPLLLLLLLTAFSLALWRMKVYAFSQWEEFEASIEYIFGEHILFTGRVAQNKSLIEPFLILQVEGESDPRAEPAMVNANNEITYDLDLTQEPIRPYSTIIYWFESTSRDGEVISSPKISFMYEDNRFDWQTRNSDLFSVHWYEGDTTYAQNLQDVAELGFQKIQKLLPITLVDQIDIYAYASAAEMREILQESGNDWVGAHTDPEIGVMVVSLPEGPEQRLEMERQIPHELMHIMLFEHLGPDYVNLPIWLNEGLASVAELSPNPDYFSLLNNAQKNGSLISITSLCVTFPRDAVKAYLAYAMATSFTQYLHQRYGTSGLERLITSYADGMSCDLGVQMAFGSSLSQLESEWREEAFDENALVTALSNLIPWLVLLMVILGIPMVLIIMGTRSNLMSHFFDTRFRKL